MHRRVWLNLGVTVVLLLAATFSSLVLGGLIGGTANAQMLFLLAVLATCGASGPPSCRCRW